jgi:glycosyltransferase involved in cell wall biosynthesis
VNGADARPELRVLHVFGHLGVGGAEMWLMALLRHFHRAPPELPVRVRIDVCLTSGERGHFDDEAASLGARLFYPRYGRGRIFAFARELRAILRAGGYHALHDHQDYMAGVHLLLGAGLLPPVRIAHLHNPHGNLAFFARSRISLATLLAGRELLPAVATHVTATSRKVLRDYGFDGRRFAGLRREAVYCGFDVGAFRGGHAAARATLRKRLGFAPQAEILLFVGRLSSNLNQKNPAFALEVARECIARRPDVRLVVAGEGAHERRLLEQRVADWGLAREIRLIGPCDDVPALMRGADLLVFPSLAEGLGMVAVEAQAAALRVLASDAVPRECVVIDDLVRFAPLAAGASAWADEAARLLALPPPEAEACNEAVRRSPFAIERSAARLVELWSGGLTSAAARHRIPERPPVGAARGGTRS